MQISSAHHDKSSQASTQKGDATKNGSSFGSTALVKVGTAGTDNDVSGAHTTKLRSNELNCRNDLRLGAEFQNSD